MNDLLLFKTFSLEPRRLAVACTGVAFAVFLMLFQGSLFLGFLEAAGSVPAATAAEVWISPKDVPCFDFSGRIPSRFAELAAGVPGVASVSRMVVGFASWQRPGGGSQVVEVVGAEPAAGPNLPLPRLASGALATRSALTDISARKALGLTSAAGGVEVGGRELELLAPARGFGTFLGSPYVFTGFRDGAAVLGFSEEEASYLLVNVAEGFAPQEVAAGLQRRLPEVTVRTRDQFAADSGRYWMMQTGAGGGIALAGLLGLVVGVAVVSQTTVTMTMERVGEIATLKALGASSRLLRRIVLGQAVWIGLLGWAAGLALVVPVSHLARGLVSWILMPRWFPVAMLFLSLGMCLFATLLAMRRTLAIDPELAFRE